MLKRTWTFDEDRTIRELRQLGYQRQEVADELGVTLVSLKRRCRLIGVRFPRGGAGRISPDKRVAVLNLVARGVGTSTQIGRQLGMSREMAWKYLHDAELDGIVRRSGKARATRYYLVEDKGVAA